MNTIRTQTASKYHKYKDNYEKGRAFEEYIKNLFNAEAFRLNKWRKAQKFTSPTFPYDISYPDLEMELIFSGKGKSRFAVECKWRKEFREGKINWAANNQKQLYGDFQRRFSIPVFVAIGIGGEPSNPNKLFVTPLDNICQYTDVYESELIPYKRKPTHKFYYDIEQLKLF